MSNPAKMAAFHHGVPTMASSTERDALIPSPITGQKVYRADTLTLERWTGSTWSPQAISIYPVRTGETGVTDLTQPYYTGARYGATPDTVVKSDGVINASTTVTSASGSWSASDIGKVIIIVGGLANGAAKVTTIASVSSATSVVVASAPTQSGSSIELIYGTDMSPYLTNWLASIPAGSGIANQTADTGGGRASLDGGNYIISQRHVFHRHIDFNASRGGMTTVVFKCAGSNAGIQIGYTPDDAGTAAERGGWFSQFTVDGCEYATGDYILVVGRAVQRLFLGLQARRGRSGNLLLWGTQNCTFIDAKSDTGGDPNAHTGSLVSFEGGAAGNCFINPNLRLARGYSWSFTNAKTALTGVNYCQNNTIFGGITEELADGGVSHIYYGAGKDNCFDGVTWNCGTTNTAAHSLVKQRKDGSQPSAQLLMHNASMQGSVTLSTAFDLQNVCSVKMYGYNRATNFLNLFSIDDNATVELGGEITQSNITNFFVNAAGGVKNWYVIITGPRTAPTSYHGPGSADIVLTSTLDAESVSRLVLKRSGTITLSDGTNAADVTLQRSGTAPAGRLDITGGFKATRIAKGVTTISISASPVAVDASLAGVFIMSVTVVVGTLAAIQFSNPTNNLTGQELDFDYHNDSGGSVAAPTFAGNYKTAGALTAPANAKSRGINFYHNGSNYQEMFRSAADIG